MILHGNQAAQAFKRDKAEQAEIRKEESRTLSRTEKREAFIKARTRSTLDELRQDQKALSRAFAGEADAGQTAKRDAFKERRRSERPKRSRTHSRDGPSLER